MNLPDLILVKLKAGHRGRENAVKRDILLNFCRAFEPSLTDRELRKIYSELPVCSCNEGIFWPIRHEEIDEFEAYLKGKAKPLFDRFRMVAARHRNLLSEKFTQWELF